MLVGALRELPLPGGDGDGFGVPPKVTVTGLSTTVIEPAGESWPPYRLAADSSVAASVRNAALRITARPLELVVCGPSNIGNYLATLGIEATAGFGVGYRNAHGTDECIDLSTIPIVDAVCLEAVHTLSACGRYLRRDDRAERGIDRRLRLAITGYTGIRRPDAMCDAVLQKLGCTPSMVAAGHPVHHDHAGLVPPG
jgi:hypothetical protein